MRTQLLISGRGIIRKPILKSETPMQTQATAFSELQLTDPIQRSLQAESYITPTPIQAQAIPHLLAGRDLLGCAQTGTGKTAAFALPILQRLAKTSGRRLPRTARALILAPTRELATQIADSFRTYGRHLGLTHTTVFGGVGQGPQVRALARGVDILVATPGRLLDLIGQGHVHFNGMQFLVLDEADRMLDMGFIPDIRRILAVVPAQRQTALFSATMPPEIARLAEGILNDPVRVAVTPVASTVELIDQRVLFVERADKPALLGEILKDPTITRVLVFTRTKHGANRVATQLHRNAIAADAIHGNKSQGARERAIADFRNGRTRVLVATDIAARGIDIDGISHVINFDLPTPPESYVHRIGRTARAGASGVALSFCAGEERAQLRDIERLIARRLSVVADHPYLPVEGSAAASDAPRPNGRHAGRPRPAARRGRRRSARRQTPRGSARS
jgi:ATP-dependent RNA helicase RhlE